jgi:competence protein ComEA
MYKQLFFVLILALTSFYVLAAPVNVNTADAATIAASLERVGPVKAQAIVDYREQHGEFKSKADLTKVSGIGIRTVEMNEEDILLKDN